MLPSEHVNDLYKFIASARYFATSEPTLPRVGGLNKKRPGAVKRVLSTVTWQKFESILRWLGSGETRGMQHIRGPSSYGYIATPAYLPNTSEQ